MLASSAASSGNFAIFSEGVLGAAHEAHRDWDAGRLELGRWKLARRLRERSGTDSEWVHMQMHLGLFELELGEWEAAYVRFRSEILPLALESRCALTDAPSLLWRLELAAPGPVELPWQDLCRIARADLVAPASPLDEAHDLLALAGAKDADGLAERRRARALASPGRRTLVEKLAEAMHACLSGAREAAALLIRQILPPFLQEIGGSPIQQQTFELLAQRCEQQSRAAYETIPARAA